MKSFGWGVVNALQARVKPRSKLQSTPPNEVQTPESFFRGSVHDAFYVLP